LIFHHFLSEQIYACKELLNSWSCFISRVMQIKNPQTKTSFQCFKFCNPMQRRHEMTSTFHWQRARSVATKGWYTTCTEAKTTWSHKYSQKETSTLLRLIKTS
jgi:hypothetical protein